MKISIRALFGTAALFVLASIPQIAAAQSAGCVVVYTDYEVDTEQVRLEAWAHVEDFFDMSYCNQEAVYYWGYWEHSYGVTIDIESPTGNTESKADGLADVPYGGGSASTSASLLFLDDYGDYEILCHLWIWCTIGQLFVDFFGVDIIEIPAWIPLPKLVLIALTFDDGPVESTSSTTSTNVILDTMLVKAGQHMKPILATFFVERERIDSTPGRSILEKMDERGHEVAVHGVDPVHHWPHQDTVDLGTKLEWMKSTINTAIGETPEHVRPPYGWVAWVEGINSKPVVAAAYSAANLERYTSSHSTGGDNSWFGDQYTFAGNCSVCASQAEFTGYATDAIDLAVTTLVQARILLMHDIRPDDAANLGTIIDAIEDHADTKGVRVLWVPVSVIARLGI